MSVGMRKTRLARALPRKSTTSLEPEDPAPAANPFPPPETAPRSKQSPRERLPLKSGDDSKTLREREGSASVGDAVAAA